MKKVDLAWAAGLVDGEGCICILRHPGHQFRRAVSDRFNLILKVTMCCKKTIHRLHHLFGTGSTSSWRPKKGERISTSHTWICNARQVQIVLPKIRPFLVTKAAEADVALKFLSLPLAPRGGFRGSDCVPPNLQRRRMAYYKKLRALKTRSKFTRQ